MNRQLRAVFKIAGDSVDVREVEVGIDALRIQIERERDEIDVAGAFAIAEEAAFNAVGAGHQPKFGSSNCRTAVVVRVQADDDAVAPGEIAVHPFDLVGVDVGGGHFDRGWQIENDLPVWGGAPGFGDGVAHFQREIELGGGEVFWAVFENPFRFRMLVGQLFDKFDRVYGHRDDLWLAHAKDNLAERFRGGVVNMHDGPARAFQGFNGSAYQWFARGGEDFERDVVGNMAVFDELTHKVEIGLRGRRKGDFDFLEADVA